MPNTNRSRFIGKTAHYRKVYENDLTHSKVESMKTYENIEGDIYTEFTMANGDRIAASACYFEVSRESARA